MFLFHVQDDCVRKTCLFRVQVRKRTCSVTVIYLEKCEAYGGKGGGWLGMKYLILIYIFCSKHYFSHL
jgi:hypothetical protein